MKTLFIFFISLISFIATSQTNIVLKARLYQGINSVEIAVQKNKEEPKRIVSNNLETVSVSLNDILSFYVNNSLVESIEISQKIIDRRSLSVLITETTVLDELEIEYTNLNNKLGFGGKSYTKAERAVKIDNQLSYKDPYSAVGNIKLDGLVNKLSGRGKVNKKALSVEKEVLAMERFLSVYTPEFLYENYKLLKDKAPYFALRMIDFMDSTTNINSPYFVEVMEEQLLNFKYD